MVNNNYLLNGSIWRSLVRFAVPVMLSMLLQVLYNAVDLIIVGNFATTADQAAVGIGGQIMTTILLGIVGLTTGLTVLLGQLSGAGDARGVRQSIGASVFFFALLSAVLTILLVANNKALISVMQTPPDTVLKARSFLLISSLGTVFIVGYNVTSSIFRGVGNSKTPLIFVAVACVLNIALDLIFVKGLSMGARGAALATVAAQAGSFFSSLAYLKLKGLGLRFERDDFRLRDGDGRLRLSYIGKMVHIGLPLSLQEMLINLSFLLITAVVSRIGVENGTDSVMTAAVITVEKLVSFLMMPTLAISMAVATMSAHNNGALQYSRARRCLWVGVRISLSIAGVLCIVCWLWGEALTALFSKDSQVVSQAALYLKTYALDCIFVSFVFNLNSYFSSCSKSLFSMIHSLLTTFLIRVPFVVITGAMAGVTLFVIGFAAPSSSLGSMILCLIYYSRLRLKMTDGQGPGAFLPAELKATVAADLEETVCAE